MAESSTSNELVLIVEDEVLIRMNSVDMIREFGFEVIEAVDADRAIAALEANPDITVVFTDIQMAGSMDGLRLAAVIRDRWPPVELIVTSGHVSVGSKDLPALARRADILVAAIGKPEFVKADWVKPGATVIDVGINRVDAGEGKYKLVGDVDYQAVKELAGAITPVPGGVGAMTIVCLMHNTLIAACAQNSLPLPTAL